MSQGFTQMARAIVYVGATNKQLTYETSVEITRSTNSIASHTVSLGYCGETPGSPMCEISVSNAVPTAGFELDPGDYMKDLSQCTIRIFGPNKVCDVDAFIYTDTFKHSVDAASSLEFKARGKYPDWT